MTDSREILFQVILDRAVALANQEANTWLAGMPDERQKIRNPFNVGRWRPGKPISLELISYEFLPEDKERLSGMGRQSVIEALKMHPNILGQIIHAYAEDGVNFLDEVR